MRIATSVPVALEVNGGNGAEGFVRIVNNHVAYSSGLDFYTPGVNRGFVGWRGVSSTAPFNAYGMYLVNTDNSNLILGTNNLERLRIDTNGDVGIGTATPAAKLAVNGGTTPLRITAVNSLGFGVHFRDLLATEGYGSGVLMEMQGNSTIRVSNLQIGYVGMPLINSPGQPLYLNTYSDKDVIVGNSAYASGLRVNATGVSTFAGSVTVAGDVTVTGNIAAKYQDVAEWVTSDQDLSAGTVVVLGRDRVNTVTAATEPFDTRVAGVVSERPGLILGEAGADKEMIATTGRVRVRVDASKQSIAIGDLLVTSNRIGMAMKSTAVDVAGIQMHRPGTIIGKALEPLATGEGEILVLLSLQ
ncbi:MAG TPA: hypothetical protein VNA69_11380 [Thermoanaerobaculia bacterium]|nr:hypothetical protein [Thermoanaerobaculia bacterium]